jgi:hypothetical protein
VNASSASTVELNFAYFPGWRVVVDGNPVQPAPVDPTGLMQISLAPGEHSLAVNWTRTGPRWLGEALSLSLVSLLLIAGAARYIKVKGSTSTTKAVAPHL